MALYAEITNVEVVSSAPAGSNVEVHVVIRNNSPNPSGIMVRGALEYGVSPWPGITFPDSIVDLLPGQLWYFTGYFVMPATNVKGHVYSYWYGTDGAWHFDDEKTKDVNLSTLSPVFNEFRITDYAKV